MPMLNSLWTDVRGAVRVLRKSPGPSILAVVSIALGLGVTTGLFSVCDALMLRSFPIHQPEHLLKAASDSDDGSFVPYGWPDYLDMSEAAREFGAVVAYQRRVSMLELPEQNEIMMTHIVTDNYFSVLGVRPVLGAAALEPVEGRAAVVIGHRLWLRRLGGDLAVIGKTIILDKKPFVVAGVMPPEFIGLHQLVATDIWMSTDGWFDTLGRSDERIERNGQFEIVVRLNPGVGADLAAGRMDAAIRGAGKHQPPPKGRSGTVLHQQFALGWTDTMLVGGGLIAGLALLLFVACANVAQLRLGVSESRRKEVALRLALGSGAWRLAQQLLVETTLLCMAGAGLGLLIAQVLMGKIEEFFSAGRAWVDLGMRIDHRVAAFALAALTLSVLLTTLAPIRHALRLNVDEVLKTTQGVVRLRSRWHERVLVSGQLAVSVALLGLALLFLASLRIATHVYPGMDPNKQMLLMVVANPLEGPWREQIAGWCEGARERITALPGVRSATFARRVPLSGSGGGASVRVEMPGRAPLAVGYNNVSANYFATMGTRVVAGRGIGPDDRAGGEPVIVVSRSLARVAFGEQEPLGQSLRIGKKLWRVVGVAEDAPSNYIHEPTEPFLYFPFAQAPSGEITLIIETAADPEAMARTVRGELKRLDPRVEVLESTSLRRLMGGALSMDRTMAGLAAGSAAFGVLLTVAGLFGLLQYTVNRRTREIGLRVALGAQSGDVQAMVLKDALRLAAWGIPAGVVLLGAGAWAVRSMLFGVSPLNPVTYIVSGAATVALALAASWLPARRATRVEPMAALRSE